jgi:hypothetical protein
MFTAIRLFITYVKRHPETGELYVGMSSGEVDGISQEEAERVLKRREAAPHHKNKDGFLPGDVDRYSTDYEAIRGREQMLKESFAKNGSGTNQNNPISPRNKKKAIYMNKAFTTFGDILLSILACSVYLYY